MIRTTAITAGALVTAAVLAGAAFAAQTTHGPVALTLASAPYASALPTTASRALVAVKNHAAPASPAAKVLASSAPVSAQTAAPSALPASAAAKRSAKTTPVVKASNPTSAPDNGWTQPVVTPPSVAPIAVPSPTATVEVFNPPTSITYLRTECTKISVGFYKIEHFFEAKGGDYMDWGSPTGEIGKYKKTVVHGGTRIFQADIGIQWAIKDAAGQRPKTAEPWYQQTVTAVSGNYKTHRYLSDQLPSVSINCPI